MKYQLRPYNQYPFHAWILVPNTYALRNVWMKTLREDLRRLLTFKPR